MGVVAYCRKTSETDYHGRMPAELWLLKYHSSNNLIDDFDSNLVFPSLDFDKEPYIYPDLCDVLDGK